MDFRFGETIPTIPGHRLYLGWDFLFYCSVSKWETVPVVKSCMHITSLGDSGRKPELLPRHQSPTWLPSSLFPSSSRIQGSCSPSIRGPALSPSLSRLNTLSFSSRSFCWNLSCLPLPVSSCCSILKTLMRPFLSKEAPVPLKCCSCSSSTLWSLPLPLALCFYFFLLFIKPWRPPPSVCTLGVFLLKRTDWSKNVLQSLKAWLQVSTPSLLSLGDLGWVFCPLMSWDKI